MAQFDCADENSWSSSILNTLKSYIGDPVSNLISQIRNMETKEQLSLGFSPPETDSAQDTGDPEESSDFLLNQLEECSPPTDISSALKSVALMRTLDLKNIHCAHVPELFSVPLDEVDGLTLSPEEDQDESTEGAADPAEEEMSKTFQSKYINFFPLYQDYCLQEVKDNLQRLSKSYVSELIAPQYLQGLQSRLAAQCSDVPAPLKLKPPKVTESSSPPQPVRVTPCTLWQDLEEVKASGLLSSLTNREIRLQESTFELIGSEASYLRSLGVAVNHFCASKALRKTLNQMEHHILFSNIRRVMAASEKFLMDLETRLGECVLISEVGDIVLKHCPEFRSLYVPYVTNMMYQETLVNQLLQQNRDFLYSIKKLESDPVCQRRSFKSFLVLPFQRITRIKLLLESILKLTDPGSDSISNLKKAIETIHEGFHCEKLWMVPMAPFHTIKTILGPPSLRIVAECDNGVRKMKQIEELVCLEMLLDFGKVKSVPLVVSGRFLVHQGPMRQLTVETGHNSRVSYTSVYLHLFNDLLIISTKKDRRFTVRDHADFPKHVHVQNLKTEVLGLPPDSFLLHISQSQTGQPTAMILAARTRSDKEAWMEALSSKK